MKKLILIMMCLAMVLPSFSIKEKTLRMSGQFLSTSNVKYEICIVNQDNSCVIVQTKSNIFSYRISLKLGQDYVIKFIKDDQVKEIFISAIEPGYMKLDVDFTNNNAAQLCYSDKLDDYHLNIIYQRE